MEFLHGSLAWHPCDDDNGYRDRGKAASAAGSPSRPLPAGEGSGVPPEPSGTRRAWRAPPLAAVRLGVDLASVLDPRPPSHHGRTGDADAGHTLRDAHCAPVDAGVKH
jgi:hypothetical protein